MDSQHQEIPTHSLENMMVCPKAQERKPRPQPDQALKCPRCDSSNTKFCYYNNYSLSQPRYFCKSCRRYWTQGGTLRNVPVGGGCRKNKRSSSSSSSASSKRSQDQPLTTTLPSLSYDHQANDLSLAFARLQKYSCGQQQLGFSNEYDFSLLGNPDALANNNNSHGFLDHMMRNGYNNNNNSHNLYYGNIGNGDNNMGGIENGGNGNNVGEMRLPYDQEQYTNATTTAVTVTTMKQELFGAGRENENRPILWGYPNWQMNNGDGNMGGEFDSAGRESWNGINASSWHGLLNSPLM